MKSNYRNIGDFIKLVDERNKGLKVTNLVGLSISKQFIKSVANTIGTDMENYKIIRKNQFACSTMQVRRDKKMPLALYNDSEPAIISQAYPVFEINDTSQLLPEYLMMWFTRTEFDREACFHAVGGVRGSLEWEDFCGMQLPIPTIEKQHEIVSEYNTIQNRIALNNQLISKLEETAQAIYKQWFVDFEFPFSDTEALEVTEKPKGYKSAGGKMVWCEELEKEIPEGWEVGNLDEMIEVKYGKDYKHLEKGNIPLYGSGGIMDYVNKALYDKPTILIPRKGSLNNILFLNIPFWSVDTMFYSILKKEYNGTYVFYYLTAIDFNSLNVGSAVPSMTTNYLNNMKIIKPSEKILIKFDKLIRRIFSQIDFKRNQNQKLEELKDLLLAKMTRVESGIETVVR
ncbi:restriction endonuclease subunit S [Flavobacterium sp.]|uniref:restriction endonuclease subunit S n=1 Tax=Flavobacterium sp. TaxID=239 RepID=UPI0035AEBC03